MANLLRISVTGAMPSGEEWSVNPVFGIGGDFGVPATYEQVQAVADALAAIAPGTNLRAMNVPAVTWNNVRVEARSLSGTLEAQAEGLRGTPSVGTGSIPHPFQTSVVISLRTTTPGGSGRGRLYFPATGQAMNTGTLRLSSGVNATILADVKTLLSAYKTAISSTFTGVSLVVWSRKNEDTYPVTSMLCGDVMDTQTRRRDILVEQYATTSAP